MAVDVTSVNPAQRYGELVTDLQAHRSRLGEAKMVGVGWASSADQARLGCHEFKVGLVAQAPWLAEREFAFVDLAWNCFGLFQDGRWILTIR